MKALFSQIEKIWGVQKEFQLKVLFLTLSFFMLTACQAIWRPLKTALFISLVGVKSIPDAKLILLLPIIVLVLIYSKLVDWLRRHHLFYWFIISHGLIGIGLYFFLIHPVYGLANAAQGSARLLGWISYFFFESFGAFMSTVFWSFANSVNKPKDAKKYYSLFVAGSKIGGITGAGLLYFFVTQTSFADTTLLPIFLLLGSLLLFAAGGCIYLLMKNVPGYLMHGYEAAYQYEKKQQVESAAKPGVINFLKNSIEGLTLTIKNSYVFGIFTIIFAYDVIVVIFDYLLALAASEKHSTAGGLAGFYSSYMLLMHSVGLFIVLFGTAPIQRFLGVRLSLFACPIISIIAIAAVTIFPSPELLFFIAILLRSLNYGLNHPTREALFIPTTKAIKFKARAWTDAFGTRMSKSSGSFLNKFFLKGVLSTSATASFAISVAWITIAYFLGRTFQKAVDTNTVIGATSSDDKA